MPDYMFLLESRLSPEQRAADDARAGVGGGDGLQSVSDGRHGARSDYRRLAAGPGFYAWKAIPPRWRANWKRAARRSFSKTRSCGMSRLLFAGDVEGSISAARDDHYVRPGTRPEVRWSTIMEDLRRRDFSLNAIAISLNPASRGLLLDPTNGLSDIERGEVRALTIHSFTNQPVRLLRVLRFAAAWGSSWSRAPRNGSIWLSSGSCTKPSTPEDGGAELREAAREERPGVVLKAWEEHDLMEAVNSLLAKKHPDYEAINRLMKVREDLFTAGFRPRLATPMLLAILGRMKDRELIRRSVKSGISIARKPIRC